MQFKKKHYICTCRNKIYIMRKIIIILIVFSSCATTFEAEKKSLLNNYTILKAKFPKRHVKHVRHLNYVFTVAGRQNVLEVTLKNSSIVKIDTLKTF